MAMIVLVWLALASLVQPEYTIGSVLASVAFMWDPATLGYLVAVLENFETYETNIQVVLVTNDAPALQVYLQYLDLPHVQVRQVHGLKDLRYLPRAHFDIVKRAYSTGQFDTYMYVENDVLIPWSSVQAWAHDVEQLQARGFQRGFLRVGADRFGVLVCPDNAPALGSDDAAWRQPAIDLSTYDKIVNVSDSHHVAHFIQLRHSYWAGYILTSEQLQAYMQSNLWAVDVRWGPLEDAACGNQFVNVPSGFDSNTVVPYNPHARQILSSAFVFHLSNKYAIARDMDQVGVADLLKGQQ